METPFGWCVAEPTSQEEDDSQPVALSVPSLTAPKRSRLRNFTSKLRDFGPLTRTDLEMLVTVAIALKTRKPLKY